MGMSLLVVRSRFLLRQPFRTKLYHYALQPKMLGPDEQVDPNIPHLFKTVCPAGKWDHTGSNHDTLVQKVIGMMTEEGRRETAREVMRLTYRQIKMIQLQKLKNCSPEEIPNIILNPRTIFHQAISNCTPVLVLNSVVRGGILYKVPCPPRSENTARHIAIKFLIDAAKDKPTKQRIWVSLAHEVLAAAQNQGKAYKKKLDLHKQCEENRAYANYRTY